MTMSGAWTMPIMWMRMPGHSWAGTAASFLVMWSVMMVAMMLPSLAPTLWCYRRSVRSAGSARINALTALAGIGYFGVWCAVGAVVFPFGVALSGLTMRQPLLAHAAPILLGVAVLLAGITQHTSWKARQLLYCRESAARHVASSDAYPAWRHGMRLGVRCVGSCAGLAAVPLLGSTMDLRVMAAVTAAITIERLAPNEVRFARAIGDCVVVAGLALIARAVTLG
jgi:predicted metal-binding membrane protein